jgi:hypothetical protein
MAYTTGDGMVALALAGGIVGYFHVTRSFRQRRMEIVHAERMAALEKGIPMPELQLDPPKEQRPADQMVLPILGIVLLTPRLEP